MAARKLTASVAQVAIQQCRDHPYIIPIFVATGLQLGMGVFTMFYTTKNKSDVILARWSKYSRPDSLNFEKPTQVLFSPHSKYSQGYVKREPEVQNLYDLIYSDGEYDRP